MLEVRDLTVRHGAVTAVRGVSFDVEAGTIVALKKGIASLCIGGGEATAVAIDMS